MAVVRATVSFVGVFFFLEAGRLASRVASYVGFLTADDVLLNARHVAPRTL